MQKNKLTHKNYTIYNGVYQIKLPLNIEYIIPEDDSVRLLSHVVEEMDLSDLYKTYFRIRKNFATPKQMLKIMIYAYINGYYSTIARFRSIQEISRKAEKIFRKNSY